MRLIRVFPRKTKASPCDELAYYGPPDLFAQADAVHVDCTFTWDKPVAEALAEDWRYVAPVSVGGVAYGDPGLEFVPGRYIKDGYTFTSRGCPRTCWFCVSPDTLIITGEGLKAIRDINVGDMVLTHHGRYRPVTRVMARPYRGEILRLHYGAMSTMFPLLITPEHPVCIGKVVSPKGGMRVEDIAWRKAGSLEPRNRNRKGEVYAYPRTQAVVPPPAEMIPGVQKSTNHAAVMALLGWYIAEGYVNHSMLRGYHRTTFCLGHSSQEETYAHEIAQAARAIGLNPHTCHLKIGIRVIIENVRFTRWLVQECGKGAATKHIPLWIRQLPLSLLAPFLDAWSKGDGWLAPEGYTKVSTVSRDLAVALREITLKLGYRSTINGAIPSKVIQGRIVNTKPVYVVIFHQGGRAHGRLVDDKDYVYKPILPTESIPYDGLVYNLAVEEDESYCTPAFAVHNCSVWKRDPVPRLLPIQDGWNILDDNLLACPRPHVEAVFVMLGQQQRRVEFTGGLEALALEDYQVELLASLHPKPTCFFAYDPGDAFETLQSAASRLLEGGFTRASHRLRCYVLIGYPKDTFTLAETRLQQIASIGFTPMAMLWRPETTSAQKWAPGADWRTFQRRWARPAIIHARAGA